jgi:hypothetical protein
MGKRNYETDSDYILDILEKEEDRLLEEISEDLSPPFKFKFAKFLAVRNTIENINVKNALEKRTIESSYLIM